MITPQPVWCSDNDDVALYAGDCAEVMSSMSDNSVDALVTDPPYGLTANKKGGSGEASVNLKSTHGRARITTGFMGMKWDHGIPGQSYWAEVLRVAKPGAHLLAFGGTRTFHRLMVALEDAGWEIRDTIMWVYGSGFPKSHNLKDAYEGWGTALKPAWEPIIVARKPLKGTVADNVMQHGTGALNIDGCRVGDFVNDTPSGMDRLNARNHELGYRPNAYQQGRNGEASATERYTTNGGTNFAAMPGVRGGSPKGRWPANLIHDGSEEVTDLFPKKAGAQAPCFRRGSDKHRNTFGAFKGSHDEKGSTFHCDTGSASRFFYCAKASRKDRNEGCEGIESRPLNWSNGDQSPGSFQAEGTNRTSQNNHPTVKPTDLMRYLCRLVTPPGGVVLDPFMGSGSTGKAAIMEGFQFIGIEKVPQYMPIAQARIRAALKCVPRHDLFGVVAS